MNNNHSRTPEDFQKIIGTNNEPIIIMQRITVDTTNIHALRTLAIIGLPVNQDEINAVFKRYPEY